MIDITSELCQLPHGVFSLEFLPKQEITGWEDGKPLPANRWYGIGVYKNSLTYNQPSSSTNQGATTEVNVGCLVVNDSQAVADQLELMEKMRFCLRITHYDGKKRIVGAPEQYCDLDTTDFSPAEIVGAQGYQLNFKGVFSKRPIVVS